MLGAIKKVHQKQRAKHAQWQVPSAGPGIGDALWAASVGDVTGSCLTRGALRAVSTA